MQWAPNAATQTGEWSFLLTDSPNFHLPCLGLHLSKYHQPTQIFCLPTQTTSTKQPAMAMGYELPSMCPVAPAAISRAFSTKSEKMENIFFHWSLDHSPYGNLTEFRYNWLMSPNPRTECVTEAPISISIGSLRLAFFPQDRKSPL